MTLQNIAIIGSAGAIGAALTQALSTRFPDAAITSFSRRKPSTSLANVTHFTIDYDNEDSIQNAAAIASEKSPLDWVIVATGILHDGDIMPEKSLRELSAEKMMTLFTRNTIVPALIAKHFIPKLDRHKQVVFAALSARVGSISDNALGGWYSYRASKTALNMIIKNAAIETARRNKASIIVGLHPGTVDSDLSKPFQANVPIGKLFRAEDSAKMMIDVLEGLGPQNSGKCFAWDGQEVFP